VASGPSRRPSPEGSDGTCAGGPPAGQWWPEMALELVDGEDG
jgi:endoglucanase